MNTFAPLALPTLNGFLIAYYLLKRVRVRYQKLLLIALTLPLGFASTSLIMFWSYSLGSTKQNLIAIMSVCLLSAVLFIPLIIHPPDFKKLLTNLGDQFVNAPGKIIQSRNFDRKKSIELALNILTGLLFLGVLIYFINYYMGYNCWDPFGRWDARYLWNTKARFYFRAPEYWTNMYAPIISPWILPDYPHLLPGSVAWGWIWLQKEVLIWPMIVSFIFPLSVCLMILWYLASEVSEWIGFLAASFFWTVPCYKFWATAQYADIPLCFFITAAVLVFTAAARSKQKKLFLISGILTGLAFWTKNEGILFTFWLGIIFSIFLYLSSEIKPKEKKEFIFHFLAGLALPLLTTLYLKACYGRGGIYLGSKQAPSDYIGLLTHFAKTKLIAAYFLVFKSSFEQWKGLWILFGAAIILGGKRSFSHYRWIMLAMVLLIDFGYFFVFHITPIELKFHIETSLTRLLEHHAALALVFTFEILGAEVLNRKT